MRIFNIRAGRTRPGLRPQHLTSVRAACAITGGAVTGDSPGSKEVVFTPGPVRPGAYSFDVSSEGPSAGAATLVFQALLPALCLADAPTRLDIAGGTHVPWSPSADYLKEVFLPAVSSMGVKASVESPVLGYYPAGGGRLACTIGPFGGPLGPLVAIERGPLKRVSVTSTVSNLPKEIAQRQLSRALMRLKAIKGLDPKEGVHGELRELGAGKDGTRGRGTSLFILAGFENVTAGFGALGERGKRAELVADEAADALEEHLGAPGALDRHLADQAALYMALGAERSTASVRVVTAHLLTNIYVIERFLPVAFEVEGAEGGPGAVSVDGAGLVHVA